MNIFKYNELMKLVNIHQLTKKEKILLNLLFNNPYNTVSYDEIESYVYQNQTMSMNALRALVKRLKAKIGTEIIQNVLDEGYTISHTFLKSSEFLVEELNNTKNKLEIIQENLAIDETTGLLSRSTMNKIFLLEVQKQLQTKNDISFLLIKIDFFTSVNHNHGYDAGDYLLEEISKIVKNNLRSIDYGWRWSGYSYLTLLNNRNSDTAKTIALRIKNQIAQKKYTNIGNKTVSIGVATMLRDDNKNSIIQRVEVALKRAQSNGTNRIEVL